MKQPTLSELADQGIAFRLVSGALHTQLGIESNRVLHQGLIEGLSEEGYQNLLAHVNYSNGRGVGSYHLMGAGRHSGWGLGTFIDRFSSEVTKAILQEGEKEYGSCVGKFRADKTKIPQAVVEHVWMHISQLLGDKLCEVQDIQGHAIPGLEEAVDSPIFPNFGQVMSGPDRGEEMAYVRKYVQEKILSTNDLEVLYARSRNALFEFWKQNYGLFEEQERL